MNKKFALVWVLVAVIAFGFLWYLYFDSDYHIEQELNRGNEVEDIEQNLEVLEQDLGNIDDELSKFEQDLLDLESEI